jgi:ATP-binding cassette subfamily A (ABC1) protein 3
LDSVRNSLGLCPQHNVLFNELTVKEHITFFSKLKGLKKQSEIDEQIRKYVTMLELTPKLNAQSKTLSGGMKRKLSVGIALCGNSKVVMCDEPTSGMDPAARRALWDVLIQEKKGRTILLTTHFMDEADVLGDRIAIMAEGELKTIGSSFFLKKKFGVGYRLVCVKAPGCDPSQLTNLLEKYIPGIQIETNIGSELTYVLKEEFINQFKDIFADLENQSEKLKISSFGVSLTTLEEVFLKVGSDSLQAVNEDESSNSGIDQCNGVSLDLIQKSSGLLRGFKLLTSQIYAMMLKKLLFSMRKFMTLVVQFLFAPFIVGYTVMTDRHNDSSNLPALEISFDKYLKTVTLVESGNFTVNSTNEKIFQSYQESFKAFGETNKLELTEGNFNEVILEQYKSSLSSTNLNYLVGATFTNDKITAWFNNQAFHSAPLTLNLLNNAILR